MMHGSDHGMSPSFPFPNRDLNPKRADAGSVEVGWEKDPSPMAGHTWPSAGLRTK